ncbi:MAG: hypothetical protein NTU49_05325 [Gammaproteobacteria bacterium]|nr:hypothetical protein [Gammaproteobacteria bacterium]
MHTEKYKKNENLENAKYGFASGAITGALIAPFERAKVIHQVNSTLRYRDLLRPKYYAAYLKAMPTFALLFGTTCAIEFSTNEEVKKNFGESAGLFAAACGGAVFLTLADRMMYAHERGVSYPNSVRNLGSDPRAMLTGFSPMLIREGCFGLSVFIFGPMLGDYLKKQRGEKQLFANKNFDVLFWIFAGTFLSGLMTTTASQSFDSITRQMQKVSHESEGAISPGFLHEAKQMSFKQLYRGYQPRLMLATLGGATVGTLFKYLKTGETPFNKESENNVQLRK